MFLNRLAPYTAARARLKAHLTELYEGITDFELYFDPSAVQFLVTEGDHSIPASRLSDGGLRYLQLRSVYPRCLEVILEQGVDPDVTDHHGFTALQHVAQAGTTWGRQVITEQERVAFATLLLDAGAGLTKRDPAAPLHAAGLGPAAGEAASWRSCSSSAAPRSTSRTPRRGQSAAPLAWAAGKGHDELVALLRRHGARR